MVQPTSPTISDTTSSLANAKFPGSISSVSDGERIVSALLLPSPTDSDYSSGHSSSSSAPLAPVSSFRFPATLQSSSSLQWCGFTPSTADLIMNKWSTDPYTETLEWHIVEYIRQTSFNEGADWRVAMTSLGISGAFQDRLMRPGHDLVRSFHPLRHWLEEFIVSNFLSLQSLDKRIQGHLQQPQTGTVSMRGGGDNPRKDFYYKEAGHMVLYRVTTAARIQGTFLENGAHDLRYTMSQSYRAHDFGHVAKGTFYYFTPQDWVVDLYLKFIPECVNMRDVCVLKIMGRAWDMAPATDRTWRIPFGDEWRELVWRSRTLTTYPEPMRTKHRLTRTFIGPICKEATHKFSNMSSWKDVTTANVARRHNLDNGEESIQWVFQDGDTMADLNDKVSVDLFNYSGKGNLIANPRLWVDGHQ